MLKKIYDAAGSIKTALTIFVLLILVSCAGTFIKQNAPAEETIERLTQYFGDSAGALYDILNNLGFTNLYHTYWFNIILLLLGVNLAVCSFQKLPATFRRFKSPITTEKKSFEKFYYAEEQLDASTDNIKNAFASVFSAWKKTDDNNISAAEKGKIGKLGALITHIGLLILIIGGFIGGIFGFNGNIAILESKIEDTAYTANGNELVLPFSIYLESFKTEYYENTSQQSAFSSHVHFLKDNQTVANAEISVNKPFKYEGVTFYQSSHGIYPNKDILFKISAHIEGADNVTEYTMKMDQEFDIPELRLKGVLNDFAPALGKDSEGRLLNFSTNLVNPAVNIVFTDYEGVSSSEWILKNDPDSGDFGKIKIVFEKVTGLEYSVLSARTDPGLPIIYLGFLILSLGVIIAFYVQHQRAWIDIEQTETGALIKFYYHKDKGKFSTPKEAEKLFNKLINHTKEISRGAK